MYHKQQHLKLILVGAMFCGFPGAAAWAHSVLAPSELSVNFPSEVRMVAGAERDSRTSIMAWLDTPDRRYNGSDVLFGTPDDQIDRMSDSAGDAHEHLFETFKPAKSWHPEVAQSYFQDFRLSWDQDPYGKPDADTWFEIKRGKRDCLIPAPATVPLPGSLLFFGSGLLGLVATLRGGRRM